MGDPGANRFKGKIALNISIYNKQKIVWSIAEEKTNNIVQEDENFSFFNPMWVHPRKRTIAHFHQNHEA